MEVEEILLNEEEFCVSLFDLLLNLTYFGKYGLIGSIY